VNQRAALESASLAPPDEPGATTPHSEEELADRLVRNYAEELRYCAEWHTWLRWDGARWARDRTLEVWDLARHECRWAALNLAVLDDDGKSQRLQRSLNSAATIAAVERIARGRREVAALPEQWDVEPFALNCPGGTVSLADGDLGPHQRADLLTLLAGTTPNRHHPDARFRRFLQEITCGDDELADYLRRLVGYWLTGDIRDPVLAFFIGSGANGKSTFLNVLRHVFGDYAKVIPAETLLESRGERHPTELANLRGVRLAICNEPDEGRRWAEARIKMLTGDEEISARYMRGDFFVFRRTNKFVIAGNHRPQLGSADEAMKRRLHIVPFNARFGPDKADPAVASQLLDEAPAILAWAVQGALEWQDGGLQPPAVVLEASRDYFDDQDVVGQWIEDCAAVDDPCAETPSSDAYRSFRRWKERRNEHPPSQVRFSEWLRGRFRKEKREKSNIFVGLRLIEAPAAGGSGGSET